MASLPWWCRLANWARKVAFRRRIRRALREGVVPGRAEVGEGNPPAMGALSDAFVTLAPPLPTPSAPPHLPTRCSAS